MNKRNRFGLFLVLVVAISLSACGSATTDANGNILVFTVTDPIDACTASQVVLTGMNFLSEHGDQVIVRLEATEGTPFNGGTSAVIEVPGTAISNTQIDFLSPIALNSVNATITILLPGGASGSSTLGLANLIAGQASSVVAFDDSYNGIIGNVLWDSMSMSVLDNDFAGGCGEDEQSPPAKPADGTQSPRQLGLSIVTHDLLTANGGAIAMNPDGTFTYNPPPGFEGIDTFNYTMSDGGSNDSATVFLSVDDVVWFIDNEADAGGDGRMTSPLNTTQEMQAIQTGSGNIGEADPGDYIFYYGGERQPYPGELTLLAEQHLYGNGVDLVVQAQPIVPASADAVLENLSLVDGDSPREAIVTLADNTEVLGITIDGAAIHGIRGISVAGPILIDNVDVLNVGADGISLVGNTQGQIRIGDPSDARSVRVDRTFFRGIMAQSNTLLADVLIDGCSVDNTGGDAVFLQNVNASVQNCTIGQFIGTPAVSVGGHGISYQTFAFDPHTFDVANTNVLNCANNGINIEHLGEGEGQPTLQLPGAPVPFIGVDELRVAIADTTVSAAGNDGLFVSSGGSFEAILLGVTNSSFVSSGFGRAVNVGTFFNDSIIVTAFSGLSVPSGSPFGGGVLFTSCTFDADPLTAGIQPVALGTWTVGQIGSEIEGDGVTFDFPIGEVIWDALNIDCQNGDGLVVQTGMGMTTFTFTINGGTITAPGGTDIVVN